jgi:hypothetical protein
VFQRHRIAAANPRFGNVRRQRDRRRFVIVLILVRQPQVFAR